MMVQKHWEFGELESIAHIVCKGEDLLEERNSKPGKRKKIQNKEIKRILIETRNDKFVIVWKLFCKW